MKKGQDIRPAGKMGKHLVLPFLDSLDFLGRFLSKNFLAKMRLFSGVCRVFLRLAGGISLLKWVFSLVFAGFFSAFGRERKDLVNLEVFLG